MQLPKRVFIDTSAWIDFTLKGEKYHREISEYLISEVKKGSKFFTSDYVLDETFTRLITGQSFASAKVLKNKVRKLEKEKRSVFQQGLGIFRKILITQTIIYRCHNLYVRERLKN